MYRIQTAFPLEGCVESRIGGRTENQDACGYADTSFGTIVVVCDGMGGMQGGSTASNLAVKTMIDDVIAGDGDIESILHDAVVHANRVIIETGNEYPELHGMGTTLTAVLINRECVYAVHVGDSRIYQLHGREKIFRTFDDSAVFQFVKDGTITEEQARVSANSNVILKALGVSSDIEFDVEKLPYDKGDRFVLCTDGFWGNVPEKDFIKYISAKGDLETVIERTAGKMEKVGFVEKDGNHDNLTAAVFDVNIHSTYRSKMEKKLKIASLTLIILLLGSIVINGRQCSSNRKIEDRLEFTTAAVDSIKNAAETADQERKKAQSATLAKENAEKERDVCRDSIKKLNNALELEKQKNKELQDTINDMRNKNDQLKTNKEQ